MTNMKEIIREGMKLMEAGDCERTLKQFVAENGSAESIENLHPLRAFCLRSLGRVEAAKSGCQGVDSLPGEQRSDAIAESARIGKAFRGTNN